MKEIRVVTLFSGYDRNYLIYYMPNNKVTDTFMF